MKLFVAAAAAQAIAGINGFVLTPNKPAFTSTELQVSTSNIGLGPSVEDEEERKKVLIPGVDYEVPDHESFRTSRRSKMDEQSDAWFGTLLEGQDGILGPLAQEARSRLEEKVPLVNEEMLPLDHEEWTPYVDTKLPWTPLVPAFGLEEYGLPIPRRNAEPWRHFDVPGLVSTDYSQLPEGRGTHIELTNEEAEDYKGKLMVQGGWLADEVCEARLIYINGRFCPQLSKTTKEVYNLDSMEDVSESMRKQLSRLTDGFTNELVVPVNDGDRELTEFKKLSGPDHCMGEPTCQFAINVQQGTACFAALNTIKTGAVAYIETSSDKPVLVVNAVTPNGGAASTEQGVTSHPRTLVVAPKDTNLSLVQSTVDLKLEGEEHVNKLYNGYTQIFIDEGANVTHSYLEESGGQVTSGVEIPDSEVEGETKPRQVEAERPALKDSHLEAIDVHCMGNLATYKGTLMGVGGSGRVRVALSVTLLKEEAHAEVNGFMLNGGAQRGEMKTNIHHIAKGCTSRQSQKNLVGGRATSSFRGRIRVEQSAQQTDSEQLSRTILTSDKSRIWSVPSLEIIADDVKCEHGATVSDLSEEELFYLRSRGIDRAMSRNLLMYAFVGEISSNVDKAMMGKAVESAEGFQKRVISRLENIVPRGDRAIKGDFQSV